MFFILFFISYFFRSQRTARIVIIESRLHRAISQIITEKRICKRLGLPPRVTLNSSGYVDVIESLVKFDIYGTEYL